MDCQIQECNIRSTVVVVYKKVHCLFICIGLILVLWCVVGGNGVVGWEWSVVGGIRVL